MFGTLTIGFYVKNTYIPGLISFISLTIFNLILASIYKMHDLLFYTLERIASNSEGTVRKQLLRVYLEI